MPNIDAAPMLGIAALTPTYKATCCLAIVGRTMIT